MAQWRTDGLILPVSVKVSADQLRGSDLVAGLQSELQAQPSVRRVPPGQLELEVRGTSALEKLATVSAVMQQAQALANQTDVACR